MGKMIIIQGREYKCKFVIKGTGSLLGIELEPEDSGTITLSTIGASPEVLINNIPLLLGDALSRENGEMFMELTAEQTALLPFDNEFGEDGFPVAATVKGLLDVDTVAEGKIYAHIPQIYVEDLGV